ncbi:MAG TPA: hypothetical protein VGB77_10535 [Abditibacteriaceae bacterium]
MSKIIKRLYILLVLLASASTITQAEDKPKPKPEFRAALPYWIPADKTTTIRVLGQDLAPKGIEFLDNRIKAKILKTEAPKDDAEKAKGNTALDVEVTAPAALPPGSYKFKLVHETQATPEKKEEKKEENQPEGRIYIDDVTTEIEEKEPNNSLLEPQALTSIPVAITGKINNEGADVFRIDGKAGEIWQFDILARRAGATWEPVMRLRDPRRALVQAAVDQGNDCTLKYQIPIDGPYLLEIFDGDNRSNNDYFYRLSVRRIVAPVK